MSSCQGELAEKSFQVSAVDLDGNLLVNETVTTLRNGFFELWLPRKRIIKTNIEYRIPNNEFRRKECCLFYK